MRLKRRHSFILLLTLLIFHIVFGIIIAVIVDPFASVFNALVVAGLLITLSGVAFAVLRLIYKLTEENTLSDSYLALTHSLADRAVVINEKGIYVEVPNEKHHTDTPQVTNVVGKRVDQVFDEKFSSFVMKTIRETIAEGKTRIIEYADDNYRDELTYFEGRVVPFVDFETGEKRVVWTSRDVTERVKAHDIALALSVERDKVKFLNEFVSNMTHDLKTPLAIINTNAYIIRKSDDETTREMRVDRIQNEVKKLETMVDDMLESARLESEQTVTMERLELVPILQTCVERLQSKAEEQSVAVIFNPDTILRAMMVVQCNRQELLRAFTNVIDNAIKYTPAGGQVNIELDRVSNEAIIHIQDTGIGIPQAEFNNIFIRFYRTANGRFHTSGTGLGLSIVQLILERHAGKITVDSIEGEGTTFTITLPILTTKPIRA